MKKIHDDLTGRTDLSRQYIYQIRKHRKGVCMICTRPVVAQSAWFCLEHLKAVRERQRKRLRVQTASLRSQILPSF